LAHACHGPVRQPKTSQRHTSNPNAKFLQRRPPRNRLGQVFCKFIELVVHTFLFVLGNSRLLVYFGVTTRPFKVHATVPVVGEVNMTTSLI